MIEIIQIGDPILRVVAEEIAVDEITSPKIQKVLTDMKQALTENEEGIAIAAPQIGVSLRIFVISKKIFMLDENGNTIPEEVLGDTDKYEDLVFINPEITKRSKKMQWLTEGCLSVRGIYGKVKRSEKATVKAFDKKGELFTRGTSGLLAQTIQHENDHLDGILFVDRLSPLRKRLVKKQLSEIKREYGPHSRIL